MNILEVKSLLQEKYEIPVGVQNMVRQGKELRNDFVLSDYEAKQGDTFSLSFSFTVFVETCEGGEVALGVDSSNSVLSVMQQIEKRLGMPVCKQGLHHAGKRLLLTSRFSDYLIPNEARLTLVAQLPITVHAKDVNGKPFTIAANADDTLDSLK